MRALFKLGQNGDVRSLGLELEPALAAKATQVAWMNGMPLRRTWSSLRSKQIGLGT
jgi:hypothetical protein